MIIQTGTQYRSQNILKVNLAPCSFQLQYQITGSHKSDLEILSSGQITERNRVPCMYQL